jgi:hypothetical protein
MLNQYEVKKWDGQIPPRFRRGRPSKYPFAMLDEVGKYFDVAAEHTAIYSIASTWGKNKSVKFSVRKMDGVLRVFRVE